MNLMNSSVVLSHLWILHDNVGSCTDLSADQVYLVAREFHLPTKLCVWWAGIKLRVVFWMFKSLWQLRLLCQRLFSCQPCKLLTFIVGFVWACQTPPGSARRPWSRTSCLCTGGRKVEAARSNDPAAQESRTMGFERCLSRRPCWRSRTSVTLGWLLYSLQFSWTFGSRAECQLKCTGSLW